MKDSKKQEDLTNDDLIKEEIIKKILKLKSENAEPKVIKKLQQLL